MRIATGGLSLLTPRMRRSKGSVLHSSNIKEDEMDTPECKHCNQPAEWRWSDADGNEYSDICQRCMETVDLYQYSPLWHFTPLDAQG